MGERPTGTAENGTLDIAVDGRIARLTIDRPTRRNALDTAMVGALGEACRALERRDDVDVVILAGSGEAFCAGGDIDAWYDESPVSFSRHWLRDGHGVFDDLARLRQPLIAVLDGHAFGGGLELAACADYRVAERHVRIGQPECGLGIIPGWSGTQRAVRRFGAQTVRRMALFGARFDAAEALALGLVDEVVDSGEGMSAAVRAARGVLALSPPAVELTKMLINAAEGEERERVLEALAGRIAAGTEELAEGVRAFREKRAPDFRRR